MTFDERVKEVMAKNFTERQARFLVTVMLHSGVCMIRQYCAFAGMVYGQTARDFFSRLTAEKLATAFDCAHKRARLYHIHNRTLYEAIGEPNTRLRKPATLARAIERVMLLDALLEARDIAWLATEKDKVEHFSFRLAKVRRREEFPHLTFGDGASTTIRYFPDRLPIGVEPEATGHVFLYLVTRLAPVDFRPFLRRHAELLRALPRWTVRLLVPSHLAGAIDAHGEAARQELASPLRPAIVDELQWYFRERQRIIERQGLRGSADPVRFRTLALAFGAPRYRVLFRTWCRLGDGVLNGLASPALADAMARQTGRIESQILPGPYLHLSRLVGTA
jgi:hypothetical protein